MQHHFQLKEMFCKVDQKEIIIPGDRKEGEGKVKIHAGPASPSSLPLPSSGHLLTLLTTEE